MAKPRTGARPTPDGDQRKTEHERVSGGRLVQGENLGCLAVESVGTGDCGHV
jgi:hypothetical protein